jgi:hypothetical protein
MVRFLSAALLMATAVFRLSWLPASTTARAQEAGRYFSETGHTVSGRFLDYWDTHGGLAQQGYPISDEMQEVSGTDGKTYTVQYFERAVFEKHPENAAPNDVLLSLLGVFLHDQKYPAGAPDQVPSTEANARLFTETGHTVGGLFLGYWNTHGALAQQGYPISDEFYETSDLDGKTYKVQYFQRAVFEYHPKNTAPYDVLLSQLGTFRYRAEYGSGSAGPAPPSPPASPAPAPAPTIAPTPTTAPEPAPQPGGQYAASATVDNPNPAQNTNVTVTGTLTRGGQGVPGATMNTTWHYKTVTRDCNGQTNANGVASCTRYISGAAKGFTVYIDVVFTIPGGGTVSAQTSFTPQ